MKRIKYYYNNSVNKGTEEAPQWVDHLFLKNIPFFKENEEIAKREAHNGEYIIEDDGQADPAEMLTQLDVIEAQVTYTAMMTDTLLEV